MNTYLRDLEKIEFVVTDACTGRCKHCSEGDHIVCNDRIDPLISADVVQKVAGKFDIKTVMVFGGEPLLHTEAVYAIIIAARNLNINHRQVITNGFFSHDLNVIRQVARGLYDAGVNDLLLSVDAFHQETIPLSVVMDFATEVVKIGIPIKLSPAWLISQDDDNPYNRRTREILSSFDGMDITVGNGNIVFPEGNATKYLSEYFTKSAPQNPYLDDPYRVKCLSVSANGDVLNGNIYRTDILDIIDKYVPKQGNVSNG